MRRDMTLTLVLIPTGDLQDLAVVLELHVIVGAEVVAVVGEGGVGAAEDIGRAVGLELESGVDVLELEGTSLGVSLIERSPSRLRLLTCS